MFETTLKWYNFIFSLLSRDQIGTSLAAAVSARCDYSRSNMPSNESEQGLTTHKGYQAVDQSGFPSSLPEELQILVVDLASTWGTDSEALERLCEISKSFLKIILKTHFNQMITRGRRRKLAHK